jgi:ribokinase
MARRLIILASYMQDHSLAIPRPPLPGETLAADSLLVSPGGKGSNQAIQAARFGMAVEVLACVGRDAAGEAALRLWQAEGIITTRVERSDQPTGFAAILLEPDGNNRIIIAPGANLHLTADHLAKMAWTGAALVVSQLETPLPAVLAAFTAARAAGVPTLLNTAPAPTALPDSLWAVTDHVAANRIEAAQLTGMTAEAPPADLLRALRAKVAASAVLTLGADGAMLLADGPLLHLPALPVVAVDTTGAGDAFIGTYAACLAAALPQHQTLAACIAAGSLACRVRGVYASLAKREEILRHAAQIAASAAI